MKIPASIAFMVTCLLLATSTGYSQQPLVYKTINEAAEKGGLADVKRHLQNGADVNARDNEKDTPLTAAAIVGKLDIAKFLVDNGADVNARNQDGKTPLMWAADAGQKEVAEYLISKGADVNAKDNDGSTPVQSAAIMGASEVVKFLLYNGADINARDNYGWTPLMWAAFMGKLEMVKFLVDKGSDVNAKDENGWTPVMAAVDEGQQDIFNYLVAKGANVSKESLKTFLVCVEEKMTKYFLNKVEPPRELHYSDFEPSLMERSRMSSGTHAKQREMHDRFYKHQLKARENANTLYQHELSKYNSALKYARADVRQDRADMWKAMFAAVPVVSEVTPVVNKQSKQEIQTAVAQQQERQQFSIQPQQERQITPVPDNSVAEIDTGVFWNNAKTVLIIGTIISVFIILVGILVAIVNREQDKGKQISFAVTSLILSIFGTSIAICCILGIVFGHVTLAKSKNNSEQYGGRIIAMTGLYLGYYTICFGIVLAIIKVMAGAQIDEISQELIRTGRLR